MSLKLEIKFDKDEIEESNNLNECVFCEQDTFFTVKNIPLCHSCMCFHVVNEEGMYE